MNRRAMTRRERLERRAARREDWAGSRAAKAATAANAARLDEGATGIPFGQPILVGHHSERRHRNRIAKAHAAMRRCVEHDDKRKEHAAAAATIRSRLATSVFSDDHDAIAQLEARAAAHDAAGDHAVAVAKAWRRAMPGGIEAAQRAIVPLVGEERAAKLAADARRFPHLARRGPVSATSDRAAARRDRERIKLLRGDTPPAVSTAEAVTAATAERVATIVAALRAAPRRDPQVRSEGPGGAVVVRLSAWLESRHPETVAAWCPTTWQRIAELTRGHAVIALLPCGTTLQRA